MLTYVLTSTDGPLYKCLYEFIREDIKAGNLEINEKMPSKRAFAQNLGVSTITVENAYDQLIEEGYMYAIPKKGYYIADIADLKKVKAPVKISGDIRLPEKDDIIFDFSANEAASTRFPFSIWAKIMKETISLRENELLQVSPCGGVGELRIAVSDHLSSFRGMTVDPDQVVIGAGTEYLYGLLVKLLGNGKIYCIENPGYKKLMKIYESNNANCELADLDDSGIIISDLVSSKADIAHISPTHHFPTGITMPISRRYALLAWANEKEGRYIVEDDYDSEFRLNGKPIPTLQGIDACEKVIYMNTFSKSLTSTIRISYMVLPKHLANLFYEKLSFYSCTVSTFEQYTLASFISQGYFEKHINRMRLHYKRKRRHALEIIKRMFNANQYMVIENDYGLRFILQLNTEIPDAYIKEKLLKEKIKIDTVTDFEMKESGKHKHQFIINYSSIDPDGFEYAMNVLKSIV